MAGGGHPPGVVHGLLPAVAPPVGRGLSGAWASVIAALGLSSCDRQAFSAPGLQ